MRTHTTLYQAVFTFMGGAVAAIWLLLTIAGYLGLFGHIVFLGAAAWFFELYSVAQRETLGHRAPQKPKQRERAPLA